MNIDMQKWLDNGRYLPKFMRDFHDQKDLFKAMHFVQDCDYTQIGFRKGQIYVIDSFLWYMAKRGYTLQKSRKKLEFQNFQEDIEKFKKYQSEMASKMFNS